MIPVTISGVGPNGPSGTAVSSTVPTNDALTQAAIATATAPIPLPTRPYAGTPGASGSTPFRSITLTNAAVAIKATAGCVSGVHLSNRAAGAVELYLHLYDLAQASVTVGTTAPTRSYHIAAGGIIDRDPPIPWGFLVAITAAITTTPNGGAAAGVLPDIIDIEYS